MIRQPSPPSSNPSGKPPQGTAKRCHRNGSKASMPDSARNNCLHWRNLCCIPYRPSKPPRVDPSASLRMALVSSTLTRFRQSSGSFATLRISAASSRSARLAHPCSLLHFKTPPSRPPRFPQYAATHLHPPPLPPP